MKESEKISMRQYAKMCDTTDRTIRVAVKSGSIKNGYDTSEKKIIVSVADKEWGLNFRAKKINEKLKDVSQERLTDLNNIPVSEIMLSSDDTSFDADRKLTIIKAQRELLKLKTESGELVNKEEVYKNLFEFGKEVRLTFQAIPNRIIDQLITLDRNAAHKLLNESINESLQKIANVKID